LLAETVRRLDFEDTGVRATEIETIEGWPAYVIETSNPIVETLQASARRVLGCTPEIGVAGPSGIGNYLASLGIPATSGFGVVYRNVHAADERIALDSLLPAYQVYLGAIAELLGVFDVAAP
jgi:succinyl-diaminopimelate desuccinylase